MKKKYIVLSIHQNKGMYHENILNIAENILDGSERYHIDCIDIFYRIMRKKQEIEG